MNISNEAQLRALYELPKGRAKVKVLKRLETHSRNFINTSPFVVLSTVDKNHQMDASPRGGSPGFVQISNDKELLIPDFKGNNRVDSLSNIVETGSIGLLFFIPGIDETLRVNGKATVTTSEDFLARFTSDSKLPISCIVVSIEEVFLHCAKAFMRSKLWNMESQIDPSGFPSLGKMLNDQLESDGKEETRENMIKRYLKDI